MRRHQLRLCFFFFGETGHRSQGCPHKAQITMLVNIEHFFLLSTQSFQLPITLKAEDISIPLTAMIDLGAALNLIHKDLIKKYNIPIQPCNPPIKIKAVNDTSIGNGICHQTKPVTIQVGLFHQELISLYVIDSPKHEVILWIPMAIRS